VHCSRGVSFPFALFEFSLESFKMVLHGSVLSSQEKEKYLNKNVRDS